MGHPPRIPVWLLWEQRLVYFVTVCVAGRHNVLAKEEAFAAFREAIETLQNWQVLAAVLMPDHVHLLAAPLDRDEAVGNLSAGIKRKIRRSVAANWQWQPGCFDRLLRRNEPLAEKWHLGAREPGACGACRTSERLARPRRLRRIDTIVGQAGALATTSTAESKTGRQAGALALQVCYRLRERDERGFAMAAV